MLVISKLPEKAMANFRSKETVQTAISCLSILLLVTVGIGR